MYWRSKPEISSRQKSFFADAAVDIQNLPTSTTEGTPQQVDPEAHKCVDIGSDCVVIATGDVYILGSNGWAVLGG